MIQAPKLRHRLLQLFAARGIDGYLSAPRRKLPKLIHLVPLLAAYGPALCGYAPRIGRARDKGFWADAGHLEINCPVCINSGFEKNTASLVPGQLFPR